MKRKGTIGDEKGKEGREVEEKVGEGREEEGIKRVQVKRERG
jgi:hypothetical protein